MGKYVATSVLDAALNELAACTRLDVTSDAATPTDLTNSLANVTLDSGDYAITDGTVSGRKVTVAMQADIPVTATGTANHVVLSASGVIRLVTTCNPKALTDGDTVTTPAFTDEIADPT